METTMTTTRSIVTVLLGIACALGAGGCGDEPCEDTPGHACVWAGTGELGFNGDGHHRLDTALYWPHDLDFAPDGTPWVMDWNNHAVRRVLADGTFESVVGDSFVGDGPPDQSDLTAPGAPGDTVSLNHPTDVTFLDDGTVLLAAWHNHKLRRIDPDTGMVVVMCGRGGGFAGDGGPVADALFNQPKEVELGPDGSLYVLDQRNQRVRRISAGTAPTIDTVAGTGEAGFSGDDGLATEAQLAFQGGGNPEPSGSLVLADDGTLYIADSLNHRIRRVDPETGIITTIAGTGTAGFGGDGGPATSAQLDNPRDLEIGPDGNLYIADTENHRIRVIDLTAGTIDTFAGSGRLGDLADGLPAREIELNRPFGIAFDEPGNLYIADMFNSRIIKVTR
jgi:DNA-binding beta-propeller fold protein YncE